MEITEVNETNKAADTFGKSATGYHQNANIQKNVAEGLISSLLPWKEILPEGPVLEIGCGTGFLTRLLIQNFPEKEIVITDASPKMVRYCKNELQKEGLLNERISFETLDANHFSPGIEEYALVISNFVCQWFDDTAMALQNLSESILPGGLLLTSFPGNHSFKEWYRQCIQLGIPYTANALPDVEEVVVKLSIGPLKIDYYENEVTQNFSSSIDFFRHLKEIGASESLRGKSLNTKQFKLLLRQWDDAAKGDVKINWHVVYLAAKKDL